MLVPNNPSAQLVDDLKHQNAALAVKVEDAKRSYAEYIAGNQAQIDKNLATIAALEPVAEWVEGVDPFADIAPTA